MKSNEDGFTLLEMVLILMITASLLLFPVLSIDKMIESVQIDLFFRELSSNITLMQNQSILYGDKTAVDFIPGDVDRILFRVIGDSNHTLNHVMYLDEDLYELRGAGHGGFRFSRDMGNITESNTIGFRTAKGDYVLTYLLGSGRFAIEKTTNK